MPHFQSAIAKAAYEAMVRELPPPRRQAARRLEQLVLHITPHCDMRCRYCFADHGAYGQPDGQAMRSRDAITYLKAVLARFDSIDQVKFFGGEPLQNCECMEEACAFVTSEYEKGILAHLPRFHVNTNLTVGLAALRRLVERFNLQMTVGIDGPPEVHDAQRVFADGSGSFASVDRNLKSLIESGKRPNSLEVVYTVEHARRSMRPTDVHRFLAERYGIESILIHPRVPVLASHGKRRRRRSEIRIPAHRMRSLFFEYGRFLSTLALRDDVASGKAFRESPPFAVNDQYCPAGDYLMIGPEGRLYPCQGFYGNHDFQMGDVSEGNVNDERFNAVRQRLLADTKSHSPVCSACDIARTCGSCPAAMRRVKGALNHPIKPLCAFRIGMTEGWLLGLDDNAGRC